MVEVRNTPVVLAAFSMAMVLAILIAVITRIFDILGSVMRSLGVFGIDVPVKTMGYVLVTVGLLSASLIILAAAYSTIEEEE